ncbi:GNAT family acetyltransferase [Streptomyces nigrescens]|uniref:GNAT family acetyltransferase n=2 Tax=Streptomyces TaxID=1883 RepID=A0ABM8A3E5_STRNI|nr:GNAT family N-acetyltransferase [Streptomyces nigrescens]MEE4422542.1 GNAT family N-acetyltransferase [Streptomyces sp. DSM 41528]BDM73155.1 GNAT family acetyltransferase [Streptomyces nigrescens]
MEPRLRSFRRGDGPAVVAAWCRSAPKDPITTARFRTLILLDPNFAPEGLRVADLGGQVVGAAYAVRRRTPLAGTDLEPQDGWILFFFVDPRHRGTGLGRRLLRDALDWLRGHGRTRVGFAPYTPHYVLPGLDRAAYPEAARLMADLGFRLRCEAAAMHRNLVGHRMPDTVRRHQHDLVARGFRFGTPEDDDLVELLPLAADEFTPDWALAIRQCLAGGAPLDRIVVAHAPDGRLAGWAVHGAYEGMTERFGPFGVRKELRGAGLGKVLLHLALERMRALGAHRAWFLWTGEHSPAGHLYRANGFTTTRTFSVLGWEAE